MVTQITVESALRKAAQQDVVFIDTRSPQEFAEDHLPRAINLPILSNEERAVVGTLYKQVSHEKALEQGISFFAQKLPAFMQEISKHKGKELIIYCWRGGMRSRSVVALLDALGYPVFQLQGGYKQYRKYVLERLQTYSLKPKIIVLWGLTCTGKTRLLSRFSNSLDLEGIAQHRGSLFGAIGLQPHSQKKFENLLLQRLDELNNEEFIFIEGESKRIGNIILPAFLYKAMQKGIPVLVTRSIDLRANEAVQEYFTSLRDIEIIKEITAKLFKVISKKRIQEVIQFLDQGEYQQAARILLEEYYDPLYSHTLKEIRFAFEIQNDYSEKALADLKLNITDLSAKLLYPSVM